MASRLAITRVTDTTRLDSIGIPVFASVRPTAMEGSLCVNAGKGVRAIEAQVGAYMEAIECAIAEPGATATPVSRQPVSKIVGCSSSRSALAHLCPFRSADLSLDAIDCVEGDDLLTGQLTFVPAELVFLPYQPTYGDPIFGSSSNGLASGNTIDEASVHGLLELIERDAMSFHHIRDSSLVVDVSSLPPVARALIDAIKAANCAIHVRFVPNESHVPTFIAEIVDARTFGGTTTAAGYGCHCEPEIALIRALTEAVQSRLSVIHGGRDDLTSSHLPNIEYEMGSVAATPERHVCGADDRPLPFDEIQSLPLLEQSIHGALRTLLTRLRERGVRHVCRVVLTADADELQVVRMIAPTLEFFEPGFARMGPRLLRHIYEQIP